MGSGTAILLSKYGVSIPADRRLSRERTIKANRREQLETISFQNRLLELEQQHKIDLDNEEVIRDSCLLYDDDDLIWKND